MLMIVQKCPVLSLKGSNGFSIDKPVIAGLPVQNEPVSDPVDWAKN